MKIIMFTGRVNLPESTFLTGDDDGRDIPYVLVCDEAFPLRPYLMRPFPGRTLNDERRVFNYRISRARRVIENAFGKLYVTL